MNMKQYLGEVEGRKCGDVAILEYLQTATNYVMQRVCF